MVVVSRVFLVEDEEKKEMMVIRNARIEKLRRNAIGISIFFFSCVWFVRFCECDCKLCVFLEGIACIL